MSNDDPLKVGDILYGYCGGHFGRDSYDDKRVEAIGSDWVVVRHIGYDEGVVGFANCEPRHLEQYREEEDPTFEGYCKRMSQ